MPYETHPAEPGWLALILVGCDLIKTPIVSWVLDPEDQTVGPRAMGHAGPLPYEAVRKPSGQTCDAHDGTTYASPEAWASHRIRVLGA